MRIMKLWAVAVLLASALCAGRATAAEKTPSEAGATSESLDRAIDAGMRQAGLVGVAAAIIIDRKLAWSRGYGFADQQRAVRFTPDTVMNIGSISKTFTGVALMQAVEEGKLSLDADVNVYLPFKVANPSFPDQPISLRQLATHTSGITDRWAAYQRVYHWGSDSPVALGDFLREYFSPGGTDYHQENFLPHLPGTHREYSNIGAALAGYIVERAVGQKLNVYTRRRIFTPLKMAHSGWLFSEVPRGAHSTQYVAADGWSIPIQPYGLTTYPEGGVRTSVADLSRFFIALLSDGQHEGARILKTASAAEMLRFQYTETNKPDNLLLTEKNSGIFWSTKYDVTRIGHGGSDPGVQTEMLSDLNKRVAVIFFCNTSAIGEGGKAAGALFEAVWKHAQELNSAAKPDTQ